MSTPRRAAHTLLLALVMAGGATAAPLRAQVPSSRPASVSLTVVVPSRAPSDGSVASEGTVALLGATSTTVDLETIVGLADRAAARIEVRLAPAASANLGRVWVRRRHGDFAPLLSGGPAVIMDAPVTDTTAPLPLRLRVEPTGSPDEAITIPLEYRVMVGSGDRFSVWSFPSVLRVEPSRTERSRSTSR